MKLKLQNGFVLKIKTKVEKQREQETDKILVKLLLLEE